MRPSGRGSLASVLTGGSTRAVAIGLALAAALTGAGLYVARPTVERPQPEGVVGDRPVDAPPRSREVEAARPTDGHPARIWDVRQAHLRQLQPVLRVDAERLSQIARRVRAAGRVNAGEMKSLFTTDRVLSADLVNHYQEYSHGKEHLRTTASDQEEELSRTATLVAGKLTLPAAAEQRRSEVAEAIVEKCLTKGPGMTLTVGPDGYQYTVRGKTQRYGGGAAVAQDEGAAFAAFTSFAPEADVTAHCDSMKKRAASIAVTAEKLAADALALAEQTTLPGDCKYTRTD